MSNRNKTIELQEVDSIKKGRKVNIENIEIQTDRQFNSEKSDQKNNLKLKSNKYNFYINDNNSNQIFKIKDNSISTTKYNIITFLPKALLFQFARMANVYFLIIAILQCIPEISPLSPITAIVPIIFVLSVSVVREGIEDYARYNYDKLSNKKKIIVHRDGKWVDSDSQTLKVGEIIVVNDEESFPADIILLDSSFPEGICYIETAQLDGEKTLKFKKTHNLVADKLKHIEENPDKKMRYAENFKISGLCTCDEASDILYKLDGNIKLNLDLDNNKDRENDFNHNKKGNSIIISYKIYYNEIII
jgi:magnesium-transporting ATPase (P-type)